MRPARSRQTTHHHEPHFHSWGETSFRLFASPRRFFFIVVFGIPNRFNTCLYFPKSIHHHHVFPGPHQRHIHPTLSHHHLELHHHFLHGPFRNIHLLLPFPQSREACIRHKAQTGGCGAGGIFLSILSLGANLATSLSN